MSKSHLEEIKREIQKVSAIDIRVTEEQISNLIESFERIPGQKSSQQILEILEREVEGLTVTTEGIDNSDLRTLLQAARPAK